MIKPQSLREHLSGALPQLQQNPEQLLIFVEGGKLVSGAAGNGRSLSFEYRYTLVMIFTDWSQHTNHIVVPLLQWLNEHQPDVLHSPEARERGVDFVAEYLNHQTADLEFKIPLTEAVAVELVAPGQLEATHLPEPNLSESDKPWESFLNGVPFNQAINNE